MGAETPLCCLIQNEYRCYITKPPTFFKDLLGIRECKQIINKRDFVCLFGAQQVSAAEHAGNLHACICTITHTHSQTYKHLWKTWALGTLTPHNGSASQIFQFREANSLHILSLTKFGSPCQVCYSNCALFEPRDLKYIKLPNNLGTLFFKKIISLG